MIYKKASVRVKQLAELIMAVKILHIIFENYDTLRQIRLEQRMRLYSGLRTTVLWRKRLRMLGKDKLKSLHRNKIRYGLTILTVAHTNNSLSSYQRVKALTILKDFFENVCWWTMTETIKTKTRYFNYLCHFMQKRMLSKIQTLESKEEVVLRHWEMSIFNWL